MHWLYKQLIYLGFLKSPTLIHQISLNLQDYGADHLNKPSIKLLNPLILWDEEHKRHY